MAIIPDWTLLLQIANFIVLILILLVKPSGLLGKSGREKV